MDQPNPAWSYDSFFQRHTTTSGCSVHCGSACYPPCEDSERSKRRASGVVHAISNRHEWRSIGGALGAFDVTEFAMPPTFPNDVAFQLQPAGPFVSIDAGPLQGRVYQNTGHIEIAGPDLGGNDHATLVHFAPPAVHTAQGSFTIGAVVSSSAAAG